MDQRVQMTAKVTGPGRIRNQVRLNCQALQPAMPQEGFFFKAAFGAFLESLLMPLAVGGAPGCLCLWLLGLLWLLGKGR